jgi:hypothetical protein
MRATIGTKAGSDRNILNNFERNNFERENFEFENVLPYPAYKSGEFAEEVPLRRRDYI